MIHGSFINVLNSDMPVDHFSGLISVRKQTGGYEKWNDLHNLSLYHGLSCFVFKIL